MRTVKFQVEHFGPIHGGTVNGSIEFKKVLILIGNQATGKSSIAKLISTISWIEKSVYKKELTAEEVSAGTRFRKKYCDFQGINEFFTPETYIHYEGAYIDLVYKDSNVSIVEKNILDYAPPKIMYVPAERNLVSVVWEASQLRYLPSPLYTFLDEFEAAKRQLSDMVDIPIAGASFSYDPQSKMSFIKGNDYRVKLQFASSGIQSLLPLFLVSKYLSESLGKDNGGSHQPISLAQEMRVRSEIESLLSTTEDITSNAKQVLIDRLNAFYRYEAFINIVEEPEQNLYPTSQQSLLYELFKFARAAEANRLIMTTHSPYIINYTTLAIKAEEVHRKMNGVSDLNGLKNKLAGIVPLTATLPVDQVSIYEIDEAGTVKALPNAYGIPSDDNYLNELLEATNHSFDQLLEIEEEVAD